MFEARFVDANTFKKIVEALKDFKEINLECNRKGISLKVMDECHVSLADLRLHVSFFEYYRCDEPCNIGLNIETLAKMIKLAPSERPLLLRKAPEDDKLHIESDEEPETGLRRAADISLINVNSEDLQVPDQLYQIEIEIPTKLYAHLIKDLSGVGEDIHIVVTSRTIKFESDSTSARVENLFRRGEGAFKTTEWHFNAESQGGNFVIEQAFAIRFLSGFAKACPLSETAKLSMSKEVPLGLTFPLGPNSFLTYYVAPTLN